MTVRDRISDNLIFPVILRHHLHSFVKPNAGQPLEDVLTLPDGAPQVGILGQMPKDSELNLLKSAARNLKPWVGLMGDLRLMVLQEEGELSD